MLNWIFWNRSVYTYKNGVGIKQLTMVDMFSNQTKRNQNKTKQTDHLIAPIKSGLV